MFHHHPINDLTESTKAAADIGVINMSMSWRAMQSVLTAAGIFEEESGTLTIHDCRGKAIAYYDDAGTPVLKPLPSLEEYAALVANAYNTAPEDADPNGVYAVMDWVEGDDDHGRWHIALVACDAQLLLQEAPELMPLQSQIENEMMPGCCCIMDAISLTLFVVGCFDDGAPCMTANDGSPAWKMLYLRAELELLQISDRLPKDRTSN